MMNVFSPMQGMNAFAQGANIGGNIRQQETQSKLAPLVANGQYQQAAQVAGERGDLGSAELYRTQYQDQLSQMGEQEKVAAAKRAEDLGRVAVGLKGVPYEQRQAMLQQQLPMLQAMGMDPQQIQGFDPNDQNLDAVLAQVTPLQDLLKGPEYFAPVETQNGFTQFSKDGSDPRQFEGIAPAQEATKYTFEQIGEEIYAIDPTDPANKMLVGAAPKKTPLATITNNMPSNKTLSPIEQKMDEHYADVLVDWNTGGQSDWQKNQQQINNIADILDSPEGEDLTGYLLGITPKWVLEGFNPEAVDAQELVEEVVQRNLRIVLGAQFTEKEGERLIQRAYNRKLPASMNAARVRRLSQLLEGRAQQMQSLNEHVQQNRTAAGWNGTLVSVEQMLADLDQVSGGENSPIEPPPEGFVITE